MAAGAKGVTGRATRRAKSYGSLSADFSNRLCTFFTRNPWKEAENRQYGCLTWIRCPFKGKNPSLCIWLY